MMDIRKVFQDVVAPELRAIDGRFEAVHAKLDALNGRVDSVEKRMDSMQNNIEKRLDDFRQEFHIALDLRDRISAIEARVGMHH